MQLSDDLEAALAALAGEQPATPPAKLSPQRQGELYRLAALSWVYRWGFSSAGVLQRLVKRTTGGFARSLVAKGLLKETKSASGVPRVFYTLTRNGHELAEIHALRRVRYPELEAYRVNQNQMQHDLIAQKFAVEHHLAGGQVVTPKEFATRGGAFKRPDALLDRTALEVELSGKWDRALDMFFIQTFEAFDSFAYDRVLFVSQSPAIIRRYQARSAVGQVIPIWKKNQAGVWWPNGGEVEVTPDLASRFEWRLMEKSCLWSK